MQVLGGELRLVYVYGINYDDDDDDDDDDNDDNNDDDCPHRRR